MSTLLYGTMRSPVPADENVVRRTATPVQVDAPPAELDGPPEFEEVETDPNPELGMVNRQKASDWHAGEKYAPSWAYQVDGSDDHNAIVDRQISTSGTAAAREAAGQFGHGSASYAIGIEPVIRDGGAFGNDYFVTNDKDIQEGMGHYMSVPPGQDQDVTAGVAATGRENARDATSASQYQAWYSQMVGG